jgi:hypothetical protein
LLFKRFADNLELELWTDAEFLVRVLPIDTQVSGGRGRGKLFLLEGDGRGSSTLTFLTTTKQDTAEFDYQEIKVHETAYSTMCAVLLYLQKAVDRFRRDGGRQRRLSFETFRERGVALLEELVGRHGRV